MHNCKIKAVMNVMGECKAVHLNFYFLEMFTKNALTITRGGIKPFIESSAGYLHFKQLSVGRNNHSSSIFANAATAWN